MTLPAELKLSGPLRVGHFTRSDESPVTWSFVDAPADLAVLRVTPTELIFFTPTAATFTVLAQPHGSTAPPEQCRITVSNRDWSATIARIKSVAALVKGLSTHAITFGSGVVLATLLTIFGPGFSGCSSTPVPPDDPLPPPVPVVVKADFVVGVTDSEHPNVQLAQLLGDESLYAWLADHAVKFRIVDMHSQEFEADRYKTDLAAANVQPPAALRYSKGKFLNAIAVTKIPSIDAVKAWIEGKTLLDPVVTWDDSSKSLVYEQGGEARRLTRLAPDQATLARLSATPRFADIKYLVPRDQWREVNRRSFFPASEWILDQDGIGECVGCGAAGALRRSRKLAGMTDHKLSPGALYSQINGGRDNGAVIGDSLTALEKIGTCTYDTVGIKPFYTRQLPPGWMDEAKRFKVDVAYKTPTFDEMVSAIQYGYVVVYGMEVGSNFERFSPEGLAGFAAGPGNHCMMADGCHKLANGQWVLDNVNSWGAGWGPFKNGRCYLSEQHLSRAQNGDAYAIKSPTLDPKETNRPVVKATPPPACKCSLTGTCECENCSCGPLNVPPPPPVAPPVTVVFPTPSPVITRPTPPANACYWNGVRWVCPLAP